jgi:hypothetical protein
VALALVLVAGCGSGTSPRATRTLPPPFDISRAKAGVLIKAGTLTAADMPGYRYSRDRPGKRDEILGGDLALCLGGDVGRYAALGPDVSFEKGPFDLIGESVSVSATAGEAAADLALLARAQAGGCLEKVLIGEFAQERIIARHVAIRRVTMRVAGAARTVAFRFRVTGILDDVSVTVKEAYAVAQVGHAQVTVVALAIRQPLPSDATLRGLLAKAVKRVKAAA